MPISFFEGGRYRNKQGSYTVIQVKGARIRVLMDDGRRGWFTVDKQQRQAVPLTTEALEHESTRQDPNDRPRPEPRRVSPPRGQLDRLRTPLMPGEKLVYEFFEAHLPKAWEIYVQPHLNGLRPDFVLMNPNVGIAVYEVKDWDLDAIRYHYEPGASAELVLWATDSHANSFRVLADPIKKVVAYKQEILNLYCPRLGMRAADYFGARAAVTAGVIMTRADTARAQGLFEDLRAQLGLLGPSARYHPVAGVDALERGNITTLLPDAHRIDSRVMEPAFASDMRAWLVEPDHSAVQREPLELNSRQRELATTRTESGYRRIKGPAGSGKSLVLAARAAQLGHHHKSTNVALRFGTDETVALLGSSAWSPDHDETVPAYFECDDEMEELTARREEALANKWARDHLFPWQVPEAIRAWREEQGIGFGDGDDWVWLESNRLVSASTLRKWAPGFHPAVVATVR